MNSDNNPKVLWKNCTYEQNGPYSNPRPSERQRRNHLATEDPPNTTTVLD
uniref:Uncharacterized protein n=1 Tax=Arion vulgaris TaxID=1028688 RepID=A0A0B7BF03_9EUPU